MAQPTEQQTYRAPINYDTFRTGQWVRVTYREDGGVTTVQTGAVTVEAGSVRLGVATWADWDELWSCRTTCRISSPTQVTCPATMCSSGCGNWRRGTDPQPMMSHRWTRRWLLDPLCPPCLPGGSSTPTLTGAASTCRAKRPAGISLGCCVLHWATEFTTVGHYWQIDPTATRPGNQR